MLPPRNWTVKMFAHGTSVIDADGTEIGFFRDETRGSITQDKETAEFAVKCVNSEPLMVHALRLCQKFLEPEKYPMSAPSREQLIGILADTLMS